MNVLKDEIITARKDYQDDGYHAVMEFCNDGYFEIADLREVVKIKRQGGKILKGQKYRKLVTVDGAGLMTYRESIPMMNIMHKYELYEEW